MIGGLENLKSWLHKRSSSWLDAAKEYSLPPPKASSYRSPVAEEPDGESNERDVAVALLRLDMGRFHWAARSSEQNMRTAIQTAAAIAPCIFGSTKSKGNVRAGDLWRRRHGSTRFWHVPHLDAEKKEPVFVIATANNIQRSRRK